MCGIIAVLRRRATRPGPSRADIERALDVAVQTELPLEPEALAQGLGAAADSLEEVDRALLGPLGIACLATEPELRDRLAKELRALDLRIDGLENELDRRAESWTTAELETVNAGLVRLRDASWAVHRDRLATAKAVLDLAGGSAEVTTLTAFAAVQSALSSLDRLEVRGRDSAGLEILVRDHGLDLRAPDVAEALHRRGEDPLLRDGSVRLCADRQAIAFFYKRAAEIGELGDNVAHLRKGIRSDDLLRKALSRAEAEVTILGHTRWASVGIISEPNAHPLDSFETDGSKTPFATGVLNGDVDNHVALVDGHELQIAQEITTDAKVIPTLVARRMRNGTNRLEAFRQTVASFEGSTAIGVSTDQDTDELMFALRGSGQALYIGLTDDAYVIASEPYGVIEDCRSYLRMDGETPGNPQNPTGSRGQIVRITRETAGTPEGIERIAFDGTPLPVTAESLTTAAITTRDVDRGNSPHFLLKEISEAPRSFRKTLRGKIVEQNGRLKVRLGQSVLPENLRARLKDGTIRRVLCVGQGTAAVAGQGVAKACEVALAGTQIAVKALPATELSGFQMRADMSDTLVIAISQSGTTTDTNRTVDLVRGRGAVVVAIVNRRGSDLTDKADGVLYTSDGRDVEMSVASTKAFYAQIAAGFLLAFGIAEETGAADARQQHEILTALRSLPDAMISTLKRRDEVKQAAAMCVKKRYWALVGNGSNLIAAREIRIKLSELCYKSIACDATEDKKHIDLSSEPMILVCAAGLTGSTADDVAKEVAIYKAHSSLPVVIADEREERFDAADAVIHVPPVHPELAFILSTVAGHLFGYECALAIDALARPLREARASIERHLQDARSGEALLEALTPDLVRTNADFHQALRSRSVDGSLEASTATRLTSLLRFATGTAPLELFQLEHGKVGTPANVVEELTDALTKAIEELTRPVDAIKHQAKTVTVGISRSDEGLMTELLVRETLEAGAQREAIAYADLRTLAALSPTIEEVLGFSRYEIVGSEADPKVHQVQAGGIAKSMRSRTNSDPRLRGTKHQVARERSVLVAEGRSDGRMVLFVPEVRGQHTVGLTLLHVQLKDHVSAAEARTALEHYRSRYTRLVEAVMETEPVFDDARLAHIGTRDLLVTAVPGLADLWRQAEKAR